MAFLLPRKTTHLSARTFCAFVVSLVWLCSSSRDASTISLTAQEGKPAVLAEGAPIEASLQGGEQHAIVIQLVQNQFVDLLVEQQGIDVVVSLIDPAGEKLSEVDSPNAAHGEEPLTFIAPSSGDYRLDVRAANNADPPGKYRVELLRRRSSLPGDETRVEAYRLFMAAQSLKGQGTGESIRAALPMYEKALAMWAGLSDQMQQAKVLNELGQSHARLRDQARALALHEQALPLRTSAGDRRGEAESLNNMGSAHDAMGNRAEGLAHFRRALSIFREVNYRYGEAIALSNIATAQTKAGETDEARALFQEAVSISREIGDRMGQATALNNLAALYFATSDFQLASEMFIGVLPLVRAAKDRRAEGYTLSNIGLVYDSLGERRRAFDSYQEGLAILKEIDDTYGQGTILNNLGLLSSALGEKQKALDYYSEGLKLKQALKDRDGEASILNGIGAVYASIGQPQLAIDYFQRSLPLRIAIKDPAGEAATLNNLGRVQSDLGDWPGAGTTYSRALQIWRDVKDRDGEARALGNLGAVSRSLKDFRQALAYSEQSLGLYREIGNQSGIAQALTESAIALRGLGDDEKAAAYLAESLPLRRAVQDRHGEAATLFEQARLAAGSRQLQLARAHLENTLALTERLREDISLDIWRASYLSTVRDRYELYIDVLMQAHGNDASAGLAAIAFGASEASRARSLLDLISHAQLDITQGVDPTLLRQKRELQERLNARAERHMRLLTRASAGKQVAALEQQIGGLTTELQEVDARLMSASPNYSALVKPGPASLPEIQNQVLDDKTLILQYSLGADRSYLWVVSRGSLTSFVLPARLEIETAARQFYDLLTERNRRMPNESAAARGRRLSNAERLLDRAGASLSAMLIEPAAALLGEHRLVIVADSSLQYLPFSALPIQAGRDRARVPLVSRHEVVHAPSASVLATLRRDTLRRTPSPRSIAVVADPVFSDRDGRVKRAPTGTTPTSNSALMRDVERAVVETGAGTGGVLQRLLHTRREADSILAVMSSNDVLRAVDFSATRDLVMRGDLQPYRIVHFATHGLLNSEHPELSGIALSLVDERGEPQDGFLRLHDIYNLRLPADLVVLSACQTGLGREIRGEGLIGLTRGFMYAGAVRVLASLWNVDDASTAVLMSRFYEALQRGQTVASALRSAQLSLWREGRWQSPYYWAGFTVQGLW